MAEFEYIEVKAIGYNYGRSGGFRQPRLYLRKPLRFREFIFEFVRVNLSRVI